MIVTIDRIDTTKSKKFPKIYIQGRKGYIGVVQGLDYSGLQPGRSYNVNTIQKDVPKSDGSGTFKATEIESFSPVADKLPPLPDAFANGAQKSYSNGRANPDTMYPCNAANNATALVCAIIQTDKNYDGGDVAPVWGRLYDAILSKLEGKATDSKVVGEEAFSDGSPLPGD